MARYLVFEKKEKYNEWLVKNKKGDMLGDKRLGKRIY